MKKQYKNPFEDPDADLYGKKVKDYKFSERKEAPLGNKVPDLEGYIYVPKIKLYVAKERSLYGLDWDDAHKELHKQDLQMLTIRQFIDFIFYLKQNKSSIPEAEKILDENGGELLDAKFTREKGRLFIHYNHKATRGKLVAKNIEPLEECLIGDDYHIDLKSCNRQGLPTKEGNDIHYSSPTEYHTAGFNANSYGACLICRWCPDYPYYDVGVRPARKVRRKK